MRGMSLILTVALLFGICAGQRFLGQKPAGDLALDSKLQAEEMELLRKEINLLKPRVAAGAALDVCVFRSFSYSCVI